MQKRSLLFILCIMLMMPLLWAQAVEVMWGQSAELQKGTFYHKTVGQDGGGCYLIRSVGSAEIDKNNIILDYFSLASMSVESSHEVLMPAVQGKDAVFENMIMLDKKLILFTSVEDGVRQKRILYAQNIKEDGTLSSKPLEVGAISLENKPEDGFHFVISEDNTHVMVIFHNSFEIYNGDNFSFRNINSNLEIKFNKNLSLPESLKETKLQIVQYELGKSGYIYLSVKTEKKTAKKGKAATTKTTTTGNTSAAKATGYDRIVLVYNPKKEEFNEYKIELLKYETSDIIFGLDIEENISVFGFFKSKAKEDLIGIFYQKINPRTLKFEVDANNKLSYYKFQQTELKDFTDPRISKEPQYYFTYYPKKIVFLDNKSPVFIAEHYYTFQHIMKDPKTKEETIINYYYYDDLLTAKANRDGKVEWYTRIPKIQSSLDDKGYMASYAVAVNESKLKIIFNDNPSNVGVNEPSNIKEFKNNPYKKPKGTAMVCTLFNDGTVNRAALYQGDEEKTVTCPRLFYKIKDQYFTYSQDGSDFKFGTFIFE